MKLLYLILFFPFITHAQSDHLSIIGRNVVTNYVPGSVNTFQFTLSDSATTSAGVFTSDSTLIRTLWSNVKYQGGTFIKKWDGLADDGTPVMVAAHVEVLSNNVKYNWDGARIGNTSTAFTGTTIHIATAGLDSANIATIGWGFIYYPTGQRVKMGDTITQSQADEQLIHEIHLKETSFIRLLDILQK